ncbi:hypothetical protein C9374_005584 [Naegleria lovaniensis]|uniref:BTB domain-containing protein n=1 Tax=Naegleria lovaniensis TaxID=51637 RepID=A0AA88KIM9_NAELO|nr:uncharacterized protein C9374_005584 [Naegleria lovaniensis]KAG2382382.1 hypothetical protein C9374_005584 [Naegleria lovaniensis]
MSDFLHQILEAKTSLKRVSNLDIPKEGASPFAFSSNSHSSSSDNMIHIYWKQVVDPNICLLKKLQGHDHLFGTAIQVFGPLISKLLPSFRQVLQNQKLLESLSNNEATVMQSIIDGFIYGGKEMKCDSIETSLMVLFLLQRAVGDVIPLKTKCVEYIIKNFNLEKALDILDLINCYVKRDRECFKMTNTVTILETVKEYCLDYMAVNSDKDEFEKFIMKDNKGRYTFELLSSIVRRKSVRKVTIDETPNRISKTPLRDIFQEHLETDINLQLTNGKVVKCHKSVLQSNHFFKALLSEKWASHTQEVFGEEMEFIIHGCYGFVDQVPNRLMIPLMKKAHELELKEFLKIVQSRWSVSVESFFESAQSLEEYLDDELFEDVKRKLVEFGMKNKKILFSKNNIEHIRKLPKLNAEIMVAFVNSY